MPGRLHFHNHRRLNNLRGHHRAQGNLFIAYLHVLLREGFASRPSRGHHGDRDDHGCYPRRRLEVVDVELSVTDAAETALTPGSAPVVFACA